MTEASHNAVILRKSDELRLNALITGFGKSEPNCLRFSELMQLLLDRCIITNRISILTVFQLFQQAVQKRYSQPKKEDTKEVATINPLQERHITKDELKNSFINELGKVMFPRDKNYQDKVYNELLSEKVVANRDSMEYPRVMIFDEINKRLLSEPAIRTLCQYQRDLKHLFVIYMNENYWSLKRNERLLLTERELDLQNKKMTAVSFVRFLREAECVPHLINIEHIEDCLSRVVPSTVPKENDFYYKHFLSDVYSKEMDKNSQTKHEGDPGLLFFEFQMAIARIAWEVYRQSDKKNPDVVVASFLDNTLHLRHNEKIKTKPLPSLNKKFLQKLALYYDKYDDTSDLEGASDEEGEQAPDNREYISEKQQQIFDLPICDINIAATLKVLDKEVPPLPPDPQLKQENPPPFKDEKIIIGQQPPPPPVDKNKQQAKPAKKQPKKKGEPQPRVFLWKPQEPAPLQSEDYFQKLASELDYAIKPLTSLERGVIPMEPLPCLISQILYPPEVPENILPLLEAGINSHNEGNYFLALENYAKAHAAWKEQGQLTSSVQLYFEFTKGAIYSSAGRDDYALQSFFNCRLYTDTSRMQYLNPDRALPWCGLGEVCYNSEQYEMAARCYLKARQIREALMGLEAIDTATVLNNLGCCFFMLDRNKESLSYFKIAHAIFQAELGTFHERTQTANSNIKKSNRGIFENIPGYRKLWEVYERDPFGKKKKKKKGDKKKK